MAWELSGALVFIDPFEANCVASRLRPCSGLSCILLHVSVPQIPNLLVAGNFDLVGVQRPSLDIIFGFPLDMEPLRCRIHAQI